MQLSRAFARTSTRRTSSSLRATVPALVLGALLPAAPASAADKTPSESPASEGEPSPEGQAAQPPLADSSTKRVAFEMASYTDTEHVTVLTPSIAASLENVTQGASLRGSYLVDVVSAASVDIVSTASQHWTEARHAGALEAEYKPHEFGVTVGGSASSEPDYFSYGLGVTMTHDFDEKNLTLLFGYGYGHDTIGRAGTPFAVFSRTVERGTFSGGVTRVIDRSTIGSLTLDVVIENGDQSKPYRYVPMFSSSVAPLVVNGASIDWVNANRLPERPLEQTPLSRHRFALSGRLAHRLDGSTVRLDERLYDDDWGLVASTTDAMWIFDVSKRVSLWPHGRFHAQTSVNFWQRAYVSGAAPGWDLPQFRTGDRELGPLWTATGGGGLRFYLGSKLDPRAWSLTLSGDVMHTAFLDDLYVTGRTSVLGVVALESAL